MIDGIALDAKADLKSVVKEGDIISMQILRDNTTSIYGERAKNGIIFVTTKSASKEVVESTKQLVKTAGASRAMNNEVLVGASHSPVNILSDRKTSTPPTQPLYILDGKMLKPKTKLKPGESILSKIPQQDILSMNILKEEAAIKIYGNAGKNGVIIITTKNAKK